MASVFEGYELCEASSPFGSSTAKFAESEKFVHIGAASKYAGESSFGQKKPVTKHRCPEGTKVTRKDQLDRQRS